MREDFWSKADFNLLIRLYREGMTTANIARELGRSSAAVATKGSRIGLYALTREELSGPRVSVRDCINPVGPHPFVSPGIHIRTCAECKRSAIFQAA